MSKWESPEHIANYFSEFGDTFNKENFKTTLTQAIKDLIHDDPQQTVNEWPRKCEKCGTLHHFWWDWYDCCH